MDIKPSKPEEEMCFFFLNKKVLAAFKKKILIKSRTEILALLFISFPRL